MTRLINGLCKILDALMAAALAVMVVLVFGNVVLRYGFNSGIAVSEEVSRWLFLWLTFLGAVVALNEHAHLGTDMLVSRLPAAGKKACLVIAQLAMLYMTWLMLRGSWAQSVINLDVQAPVTGASVAIFYATGVFFGAVGLVIIGWQFWRTVTGQVSEQDLVMVQDSEDMKSVEDLDLAHSLDDAKRRP